MSTNTTDLPTQFVLNNGAKLPAVGLGSWMGAFGEGTDRVETMVGTALKLGYRAFDTAAGYGNEEAVGRAIRTSDVPRNEIFVTTKLRKAYHHRVEEGLDESLKALGLDYVDLYLIHWPMASIDGQTLAPEEHPTILDTWHDMEKLLNTGKVKAIGVSNFSIERLQAIIDDPESRVIPAVNQVECHPSLPQFELVEFSHKHGIHTTAYCSIGRPGGRPEKGASPISDVFFAGSPLQHLADKHTASVAQVLLSWAVIRGLSVIPKSENESRMAANRTLVALDADDMHFLNSWHRRPGMWRSLCPFHVLEPSPGVFGWTYEQLGWSGMREGGIISP